MKTSFVTLILVGISVATPIGKDASKLITTLKPTSDRITAHGYPAEEHSVETVDGYVIRIFRIPYSHKLQNQSSSKPVVFIQHGMFSCSDTWIAVGPDNGLPFLLADLGYDVWMGNVRGNTYGRFNTRLSVNHPRFWRFSWHEIGVYDMPAMIDYILMKTDQETLHYVGHSQGTTLFLVLMSMRPEYNDKIRTAQLLAPVGYMTHMKNKFVTVLAPYMGVPGIFSALFGSAEFLPRNELILLLGYNACGGDVTFPQFCSQYAIIYDGKETNTNLTALPIIAETHPAGASSDQILHFMQEYVSGHFRQFDFGTRKNLKIYNQTYPLDYTVEDISSEVHIYYSDNDRLSAVEDVKKLADRLPNLKSIYRVPDPTWSHTDFNMAYEVKALINDRVIDIINEYESK